MSTLRLISYVVSGMLLGMAIASLKENEQYNECEALVGMCTKLLVESRGIMLIEHPAEPCFIHPMPVLIYGED